MEYSVKVREKLADLIWNAIFWFVGWVIRILFFPWSIYYMLATFHKADMAERKGDYREAIWKYASVTQMDFILAGSAKKRLGSLLLTHGVPEFDGDFISRMEGIPVGQLGDPGTLYTADLVRFIDDVARQQRKKA